MDPLEEQRNLFEEGILAVLPSDITLDDAHMIPVEVLDWVSFQLQYEAEDKGLKGLVPPSRLFSHYQEKRHLDLELRVPETSGGINIHYLQSQHYVVSYKAFTEAGPTIRIYDSLSPGPRMWGGEIKRFTYTIKVIIW